MKAFLWALDYQPEVRIVSRVPFSPQNVQRQYEHMTFALHQHHYTGRVTIGRKSFDLKPGDVTLTPPDTISRYVLADAGYHWCVHFNPASFEKGAALFKLPFHIPLAGRGAYVTERMRDIAEVNRKQPRGKRQSELAAAILGSKFQSLLLSLALQTSEEKSTGPKHRKSDDTLDAVKERLDQEFTKPFVVADLARESGLSGHYFSARFQERFGVTVNTYLLNLRLEMARYLLISTNLPVKEVAYECGIQNPNYFNKQFRRLAGCSPSDYRLRNSKSGTFVPVSW